MIDIATLVLSLGNLAAWVTAKLQTLEQVRATLLALVSAIPGHDVVS